MLTQDWAQPKKSHRFDELEDDIHWTQEAPFVIGNNNTMIAPFRLTFGLNYQPFSFSFWNLIRYINMYINALFLLTSK